MCQELPLIPCVRHPDGTDGASTFGMAERDVSASTRLAGAERQQHRATAMGVTPMAGLPAVSLALGRPGESWG